MRSPHKPAFIIRREIPNGVIGLNQGLAEALLTEDNSQAVRFADRKSAETIVSLILMIEPDAHLHVEVEGD